MGQTVVKETQPSNAVQVQDVLKAAGPSQKSAQNLASLPGFGHLVLRWQKRVVNGCRGRVPKGRQTQKFDLRQAQRAGVSRPVQPQAHG